MNDELCTLAIDNERKIKMHRNAFSASQTLSRHRESRTMDRMACRPGHYTGSEGSGDLAKALQLSIGHPRKLHVVFPCDTRHAGYNRVTLLLRHQENHYQQLCVHERIRRPRFIEINPHFVSIDVSFTSVTDLFFFPFTLIYEI